MNKVLYAIMACLLLTTACKSNRKSTSLSDLNGEWNITEVNGTAVTPAPDQEQPFLGFDAATGNIYGNAGCNALMSSFDTKAEPGQLVFEYPASTRMMCPDMATEDAILQAIASVTSYNLTGKGEIELTDTQGKVLLHLVPKAAN